jgi:RNA polymerase sigma factor (TIGR02999 family)
VYGELRKLANGYLRQERVGHTLQPTALVHEAYVRLVGRDFQGYSSRAHFLAIAANVMRQVLIDHARSRRAAKRGSGQEKLSLNESIDAAEERPISFLAVSDALSALEQQHPHQAKLIEMRFFGGLTAVEMADLCDLRVDQVRSDLRLAQAWLRRELRRSSVPYKHLQF